MNLSTQACESTPDVLTSLTLWWTTRHRWLGRLHPMTCSVGKINVSHFNVTRWVLDVYMCNTYESGLARLWVKLTTRLYRVMDITTCCTLSSAGIFSILKVPNITPTSCIDVHCYHTSRLAGLDRTRAGLCSGIRLLINLWVNTMEMMLLNVIGRRSFTRNGRLGLMVSFLGHPSSNIYILNREV